MLTCCVETAVSTLLLLAGIEAATTLEINAKTLEIRWKGDVSLPSCHPLRQDVRSCACHDVPAGELAGSCSSSRPFERH